MYAPATALSATEIVTLEACAAHGPHPRMRRRAQAVRGHHRGLRMDPLAVHFAVGRNAVSRWLVRGQRQGVAGLAEGRRAGRPRQLPSAAEKK